MPEVSIRDNIKDINQFQDTTYWYRKLGRCIYQGYLPFQVGSEARSYNEAFYPYMHYSEYLDTKGVMRRRKTLNFPYTIGRYIINNQYAEYPDIMISFNDEESKTADNETKDLLDILKQNNFKVLEKDNAEVGYHIGDRILKPFVENNKVTIQYIDGDQFYTTSVINKNIVSGVFPTFREITKGRKTEYYTRLEWHYDVKDEFSEEDLIEMDERNITVPTGRVIKIEIYKGDNPGQLKTRCSYNDSYHIFGNFIIEREFFEDLEVPTFVFIKNPAQNNKDTQDGRGIGGVVNTIDTLVSIDEALNAKSTDNVYGQLQIFTPESNTEEVLGEDSNGNYKKHRHFDPNNPVHMVYDDAGMGESKPEVQNPTLRTEQHISSMNVDLDLTSTNVGVNPGTFRYDGKSIQTATARIIERTETARTIIEYENATGDGWTRLFLLIKYYANKYAGYSFTFEEEDIKIIWHDNIAIDDEKHKEDVKELYSLGTVPSWFMNMTVLSITEEEARQLSIEANAEKSVDSLFDTTLPVPQEGETEADFITRFMANEDMQVEYPDEVNRREIAIEQYNG